jgi:integrase
MARGRHLLSDKQVQNYKGDKTLRDGGGLFLQGRPTGTKDWFYRYKIDGKTRRKGLGSYPKVSLERAREKARQCEEWRDLGLDPIDHERRLKQDKKLKVAQNRAKLKTFKQCVDDYIDSRKSEWSSDKHGRQWKKSLEDHAFDLIGDLLVVNVLQPIWTTKTETATRVRQRIQAVLDYAKTMKYRSGENPALWKGHLDNVFSKPSKIHKVEHFAAMPFKEVPEYFRGLKEKSSVAALALRWLILTACRNGEVRGATWDEIDLEAKVWVVPKERMKAAKEHRVPLSVDTVAVLELAKEYKSENCAWVFPGLKCRNHVTEAAIRKLMKDTGVTMHGFRSSFRDWAAELTNFPRHIAEACLAHTIDTNVEKAYRRGDLLKKRRQLMKEWENFLLNSN